MVTLLLNLGGEFRKVSDKKTGVGDNPFFLYSAFFAARVSAILLFAISGP